MGAAFGEVELVEADLSDELSIDRAISGCQYVVHTAFPVLVSTETIMAAANGTDYVMKACRKHGVKRVVVTSSIAACLYQED